MASVDCRQGAGLLVFHICCSNSSKQPCSRISDGHWARETASSNSLKRGIGVVCRFCYVLAWCKASKQAWKHVKALAALAPLTITSPARFPASYS